MHKIKLELIKIEGNGYHLGFEAKINGITGFLLLDTGASKTVLDKNQSDLFNIKNLELLDEKSTGLGTNTMEIHAAQVDLFELGSKKIENITLAILDLNHVNETYEKLGLKKIQGVLGSDLLYEFKGIINFAKLELELSI